MRHSRSLKHFALPLLAFALSLTATAQTYKFSTLYSFKKNGKDPKTPTALIIDSSGNLYGSSALGGVNNYGSVFKVTPYGALSLLYSFNPSDSGNAPVSPANLARDTKGDLYGDAPAELRFSAGVIFKLAPEKNGTYTYSTVYNSAGSPQNVTLNSVGNLYWFDCGSDNGFASCEPANLMELSGAVSSVLWNFSSFSFLSTSNLIIDRSGDVYGGVLGDGGFTSWGYVFKWSPTSGYSILHNFTGTDGSGPDALRQDAAGDLYGTTGAGGENNYGTVFKIASLGAFSTLYNFCSKTNCADGMYPQGSLTLDSKNNLYGVTQFGVFKLTPGGVETSIYNSGSINMGPGLAINKSGDLYGTTINGGANQLGSVYKLTP